MIGEKFGRLTVRGDSGERRYRNIVWTCDCDCGKQANVLSTLLRSGKTKSCGCLRKENTSALNRCLIDGENSVEHPLYTTWCGMKGRCYNKNHHKYPSYGGRGISVCDRWLNSFKNFAKDMGERPKDHTLDREDNDGNYCPSNCRWSSHKNQANNRRPRGG